jgi:hypothetical protein
VGVDAIKSINKILHYMTTPEKLQALLVSKKKLEVEFEALLPTPVKNDTVKVTAMKLWLNHGIKLMRYPEKKGSRYVSTLRLVRQFLFYSIHSTILLLIYFYDLVGYSFIFQTSQ